MAPAGLLRRIGALIYDTLLIIALEIIAAGLVIAVVFALEALGLINYGHYPDAASMLSQHPTISPLFTLYLAAVWVGFLIFFWTQKGQTLGMRAWKLRLVQEENQEKITATQSLIRIGTSAFGLSNLAVPFDPKKRAFHDIWAKTQMIVEDK